jgi:integrase
VEPALGDLEPAEVDTARLRAYVEDRLATGLNPSTVGNTMRLISTFFTHLVEEGIAEKNPVLALPRAVKRLYRNKHDPRATPFLERLEDVARIQSSLAEPVKTIFSIGVMAGLRPGEIVALEWSDFRSDLRLVHVQRRYLKGKIDVPKSGKTRAVPISPSLSEILRRWRSLTGGVGLVFKPEDAARRCIDPWDIRREWLKGLERAGLPWIKFYCATRHTFASQWVMAGHSIEKLSKILGHSSIVVTEIYAHLKPEALSVPDLFSFGPSSTEPMVTVSGEGRAA